MMRFLGYLIVIVAAVLGGVWFYAGTIVQKAVNEIGPEALGVPVSVGTVNVSLLSGAVSLNDFSIGNVSGFESENLMKVSKIAVAVNLKSLMSDTIVVDHIVIEKPQFWVEGGASKNNVTALQQHVTSKMADDETEEKEEHKDDERGSLHSDDHEPKQVKVALFTVTDGKITLKLTKPVKLIDVPVPLPTVKLTNVGGDNGASAEEVAQQLVAPLTQAIQKASTGAVQESLKQLKGKADDLKNQAKSIRDKAKSLFKF